MLHLSALDDFLRYSPQSGFKGYPPGVDVEDIVAHLDHLMEMIKTYSGYELVLTPAPLPFYFVTYDITRASRDELITIFFRHAAPGYFDAVSGFGVYDQAFGKTILRNVVSWIMKDPSSIREKEQVLEVLEAVKKRVLARDFLPYTAEEHVLERIQTPAENRRYLSFGGASMPEEAKTGLRRRSL